MKNNNHKQDDVNLVTNDVDCGYLQQIVSDSMNECVRQDYIPTDKLRGMKLIIDQTSSFTLMKGYAEKKEQPAMSIVSSQHQG
ncbi:hypothetical protein [Endozoicomonas ascidiicola]|uniref:hypothetical protein n=1 Tax=Endozoicomonas ascidiicola TaxID=1698521 RepID=UPI0008367F0E|nr:hypothetical protein [Endozoicomonas ascidiicola]